MNLLLPVSLAVVLTTCSAQILIQGEPVQLPQVDQMLGGKTDVDVNRKDVKEIADFATSSLSMKKNAAISLVKIVKAQTQVSPVFGVPVLLALFLCCYIIAKISECTYRPIKEIVVVWNHSCIINLLSLNPWILLKKHDVKFKTQENKFQLMLMS